jgi:replication factor A1
MKISELRTGQGSVNIEAAVIEISEAREFQKYGRTLRVATATIKDDSGTIKLSLWNADIERVKKGDTVKITNGYASEFQGEKQLTTGKFGKLEVLEGKSEDKAEEAEEKVEEKVEDKGEKMAKTSNDEYQFEPDDEVEEEEETVEKEKVEDY